MLDIDLTRREFLQSSSTVLIGTIAASSGMLGMLAPSKTWALELTTLDKTTAKTLLNCTRHIYPHATLDDAVYALVVKDLDAAASDKDTEKLLTEGVAALNEAAGGDWLAADEDKQFSTLESMSEGDFFQKIRGTAIVSLYNNEMAWAHFGYEGDAWKIGGYLTRGFNDLTWLPDPPKDASPPPFIQ